MLSLPRPSGNRTLAGLLYESVVSGHPLLKGRAHDPPTPLVVQRLDAAYLLPRSGGYMNLHECRALLVGCGAVGGHIALGLARAGIGQLTIVDPDVMRPENIFRHVLGKSAVSKPKAIALRHEIEDKYPYVRITTHEILIEEALAQGTVKLSEYDLVISALGNTTIERYLNRCLHERTPGPLAVFAWLEPHGIGGHALLTHPGRPGCLECLYTSLRDDNMALVNRAALAAPGQRFGKDDLGCGSLYTPYGALDAERTAVQACSLAIDGLLGYEEGSPILTWKGSAEGFIAAGFRTSERYQLSPGQLHETRYTHIAPSCPVCGGCGG